MNPHLLSADILQFHSTITATGWMQCWHGRCWSRMTCRTKYFNKLGRLGLRANYGVKAIARDPLL